MVDQRMHDYSGERGRGAQLTVQRPIGADSKIITVSKTAAPGALKWLAGAPSPTKSSYAAGENVALDFGVHNEGDTAAAPKVTITDADTGGLVYSYQFTTTCEAGRDLWIYGVVIGKMPNKAQWRLRCDLSP